jgi:hypothetical protein
MLDVFDSQGQVRLTYSDEELASLPLERQERLGALLAAHELCQETEQAHADATKKIVAAVKVSDEAAKAMTDARPRQSFVDLVRQSAEAARPDYVGTSIDPETEKRVLAAAAAADAAESAVAAAHRERGALDVKVKATRIAFAKALAEWTAELPKVDQKDLIAAVAATEGARKLAEKALTEAIPPTHLDARLRAGAKRGYALEHPNIRRLPSQR